MNLVEIVLGSGLAGLLVILAAYFAWRQKYTLRRLWYDTQLMPEDRRYLHRQAVRRIFGSVLMLVLAAFLVGWFFLAPDFEALRPVGPQAEMPESTKDAVRFFSLYWIAAFVVFLAIITLAMFDFISTARFGRRHQRQLEQDHRESLQAEAERFRRRRAETN